VLQVLQVYRQSNDELSDRPVVQVKDLLA